ncbi:hypothetical protein FGIG_01711 [Fasciola gigantica]|uniref:Uncharacterized protein n=1 Tax=Fasciola gigantica TaxID=46835 RepID=A0A504YT08_FASGI|nr:hypothetical protein FGIG_01711 [Fasciola gigantica]
MMLHTFIQDFTRYFLFASFAAVTLSKLSTERRNEGLDRIFIEKFVYPCHSYFRRMVKGNSFREFAYQYVKEFCDPDIRINITMMNFVDDNCQIQFLYQPNKGAFLRTEQCASALSQFLSQGVEIVWGHAWGCPSTKLLMDITPHYKTEVKVDAVRTMDQYETVYSRCIEPSINSNVSVTILCRVTSTGGYRWFPVNPTACLTESLQHMSYNMLTQIRKSCQSLQPGKKVEKVDSIDTIVEPVLRLSSNDCSPPSDGCNMFLIPLFAPIEGPKRGDYMRYPKRLHPFLILEELCPAFSYEDFEKGNTLFYKLMDQLSFSLINLRTTHPSEINSAEALELAGRMLLYLVKILTQHHKLNTNIATNTSLFVVRRFFLHESGTKIDECGNMAVRFNFYLRWVMVACVPFSDYDIVKNSYGTEVGMGITLIQTDIPKGSSVSINYTTYRKKQFTLYKCAWSSVPNLDKFSTESKYCKTISHIRSSIHCECTRPGIFALLAISTLSVAHYFHPDNTERMLAMHLIVGFCCLLGSVYNFVLFFLKNFAKLYAGSNRNPKHVESYFLVSGVTLILSAQNIFTQLYVIRKTLIPNCAGVGGLQMAVNMTFHCFSLMASYLVFAMPRSHFHIQLTTKCIVFSYVFGSFYGFLVSLLSDASSIVHRCMPVNLDKFLAYPSIGLSCASLLFLFLFLVYRPRRNWDEWIGALVMTVLCAVLGVEILVTQNISPTKDFDEHYFIVIILLRGFILTAYHCLLKWGMLRFYVRIAGLHCTLLSKLCPKKKRKPKSAFVDRRVTEETSWDDSTLIAQILAKEERNHPASLNSTSSSSDLSMTTVTECSLWAFSGLM